MSTTPTRIGRCASSPSLDTLGDFRQHADQHKPTDPAGITAAARQLAATGLKPRDIASILGLNDGAVRQLLIITEGCPPNV